MGPTCTRRANGRVCPSIICPANNRVVVRGAPCDRCAMEVDSFVPSDGRILACRVGMEAVEQQGVPGELHSLVCTLAARMHVACACGHNVILFGKCNMALAYYNNVTAITANYDLNLP
jgi:hypothetical protein